MGRQRWWSAALGVPRSGCDRLPAMGGKRYAVCTTSGRLQAPSVVPPVQKAVQKKRMPVSTVRVQARGRSACDRRYIPAMGSEFPVMLGYKYNELKFIDVCQVKAERAFHSLLTKVNTWNRRLGFDN